MRKLLISVAVATATIAAAVPAAAQDYAQRGDRGDRDWNRGGPGRQAVNELLRDLSRAEQRIDRARGISRREAVGLRNEARQIRFSLNLALRNGINAREFASLRVRVNRLEARVRFERHDRDNRRY
ncbi:MAG TPA: hypothetical protein VMS43_08445 [Allosphingosinicella sp.]|nr:hypothetical protein [Allosphingosinicella sp.]